MRKAQILRERLAFDVQRLAVSAGRMAAVSASLDELERSLRERAVALSREATLHLSSELDGDGLVQIRYAQAQATAELARRAALQEISRSSSPLALISSMAMSRWIAALSQLQVAGVHPSTIRNHVEVGRVAHRTLQALTRRGGLRSGCGQLSSAVVVAEFVHPDNAPDIEELIEEGFHRGMSAWGVRTEEDVLGAASAALRVASQLLDEISDVAEPAARALVGRAELLEEEVRTALATPAQGR